MAYIIQGSGGEQIPAGSYQNCKFLGTDEFESTDKGKLLRWKFELPDSKGVATGVTSAEDPRITNKLGKWLCALGKAPLQEGTPVNPPDYIGRLYFVVVVQKTNGTSIEMLSAMW